MWQRLPRRPLRTATAAVGCAVPALLTALVCVLAAGAAVAGDFRSAAGLAAAATFLGAFTAVALRLLRAGVFIGGDGIRVRRVASTTTVPWHDVAAVESRPGHALGFPVGRDAVWIVRHTGEAVETTLQRRAGPWSGGSFDHEVTVLVQPAYERVLAVLRDRATSASR